MALKFVFSSELSREELRGFARTVTEIEWVLLVLVLLYQLFLAPDSDIRRARCPRSNRCPKSMI